MRRSVGLDATTDTKMIVLVIIGWVGDDIIYKITDTICLQRKTIMG
jgi:hypothetical protein